MKTLKEIFMKPGNGTVLVGPLKGVVLLVILKEDRHNSFIVFLERFMWLLECIVISGACGKR